MAFVENAGVKLYWQEAGKGPPILLIMGLSFTLEMWFRVLPALVGSYRTITFDNRGVGRSDVPRGPYSIRGMAEDARAVLDAAGVESAHVIGASMGGMIAQEFALRYPGRVRSLSLGCTSYSGMFGRWPEFRYGPGFGWLRLQDRVLRERKLRRMLYAATTPEDRIEEDIRIRCGCGWTYKGVLSQLAGILLWSSYRRLPAISVPTLVLHGAEDHLVPPMNGRVVAARIPNARFALIPEAGHILTTDQPEITIGHLVRFLGEQEDRIANTEYMNSK